MIDPISASTAFATIVGLVCNYAAEHRSGSPDPYADFMDSLRESHDGIRRNIEKNNELNQSLRSLLSQGNDVVLKKLESLDHILAGVAANLDDFRSISIAVHREELLSDEAIEILKQFCDSGSARFLEMKYPSGIMFLSLDGGSGNIGFDHRFLEDDLRTLCNIGLLRLDHNSKGDRIFILTRQADRYIKAIREN
jgi:hypothetical protein